MNRVQRDYCNKGHHPNWRAWSAKYTPGLFPAHIGNFCEYCGADVTKTCIGGGPPPKRNYLHRKLQLRWFLRSMNVS